MPDKPPPSPELNSALRSRSGLRGEIVQSDHAGDKLSRTRLAEAAFRGDQLTVEVTHLKQIRLCVMSRHDPDVQGSSLQGLTQRRLESREPVRLSDEARAWFFRGPRRGQG